MRVHVALTPADADAWEGCHSALRGDDPKHREEIARALLVPEATVGQRVSRAKRTLAARGVPVELPRPEQMADRLSSVLMSTSSAASTAVNVSVDSSTWRPSQSQYSVATPNASASARSVLSTGTIQ